MPNEIANLMQGIIADAASTLPKRTGAVSEARKDLDKRTERLHRAGSNVNRVVLADVSSSMADYAGSRRKIDILRDAVDHVLPQTPNACLVAFHSLPAETCDLPEPQGGTALHLALQYAASLNPRATLVVSDGEPDDEKAALHAADTLPGVIDVLYVGPDDNHKAIAFMRRLARAGCGRVVVKDLRRGSPALEICQMLALPAPGGSK